MTDNKTRLALLNPSSRNSHIFASFYLFYFHRWEKKKKKKHNKWCCHLLAVCTEYDLHTVEPDLLHYTWKGRMLPYVCRASVGSCPIRSLLGENVGRGNDRRRVTAAPPPPPADLLTSAVSPTFISTTTAHARGSERSRRKCGHERRRQEIWCSVWVRSPLKLRYIMLEGLDGNRRRGGGGLSWRENDPKNKSCLMRDSPA